MLACSTAVVACGDGGDDESTSLTSRVVATDMLRFEPDRVNVRFDRETVITLDNEDDDRQHNFTVTHIFVDADNFLSVDVAPGESTQVRFTVSERPRDGFLSFYCRFHQSEGMSGRILIR